MRCNNKLEQNWDKTAREKTIIGRKDKTHSDLLMHVLYSFNKTFLKILILIVYTMTSKVIEIQNMISYSYDWIDIV